jgi:hypothetical protein
MVGSIGSGSACFQISVQFTNRIDWNSSKKPPCQVQSKAKGDLPSACQKVQSLLRGSGFQLSCFKFITQSRQFGLKMPMNMWLDANIGKNLDRWFGWSRIDFVTEAPVLPFSERSDWPAIFAKARAIKRTWPLDHRNIPMNSWIPRIQHGFPSAQHELAISVMS